MIDYSKYPPNWKTEIVPRILKRAGAVYQAILDEQGRLIEVGVEHAHCEECGVENHSPLQDQDVHDTIRYVVLTVHHKDEDPENWEVTDDRLIALCQRCHLAKHRGWKPDKKIQFEMFQLGNPDMGR